MEAFSHLLGMHLTKQQEGEAVVELDVDQSHLNSQNMCHGGVLMSMADLAMGAAASSFGGNVVTMDLQYRFFQPARLGEHVKAEGVVIRNGSKVIVTEGRLTIGDRLIGLTSGQFYHMPEE